MVKSTIDWKEKQMMARIKKILLRNMPKALNYAVIQCKKSMKDSSAMFGTVGGKYQRKKMITHSPPGSPPFVQTGTLRNSIDMAVKSDLFGVRGFLGVRKGVAGGDIKSKPGYARALELGYPPRNLKPRPYLRPAIVNNKRRITQIIATGR